MQSCVSVSATHLQNKIYAKVIKLRYVLSSTHEHYYPSKKIRMTIKCMVSFLSTCRHRAMLNVNLFVSAVGYLSPIINVEEKNLKMHLGAIVSDFSSGESAGRLSLRYEF